MKRMVGWMIMVTVLASSLICVTWRPAFAQDAGAGLKIGFVNLEDVFNKYEETLKVNEVLSQKKQAWKDKLTEMDGRGKELADTLKMMNQDSPDYRQKEQELRHLETDFRTAQEESEKEIVGFLVSNTERIYLEIREEIEAYGKENGYMLILKVDFMDIESIHSNSLASLNEKIQTRPVLFYNPDLDITEAIITRLNEK